MSKLESESAALDADRNLAEDALRQFVEDHEAKVKAVQVYTCYSTVTCKGLLNWPHSKLGQYCAYSLPNLGKRNNRRCASIALLLHNPPSFEEVGFHLLILKISHLL